MVSDKEGKQCVGAPKREWGGNKTYNGISRNVIVHYARSAK
jgi:hypothetical protein